MMPSSSSVFTNEEGSGSKSASGGEDSSTMSASSMSRETNTDSTHANGWTESHHRVAVIPPPLALSLNGVNSSNELLASSSTSSSDTKRTDNSPILLRNYSEIWTMYRTRFIVALYIGFVFFCYAFAMFINGIGKQITQERPLVDVNYLTPGVALIFDQLGPLFSLSFYRMVSVGFLLGFMWLRNDVPVQPDVISFRLVYPVLLGASNALGYLFYMVLCGLNGVALWSSLVGCYIVMPVSYGIFFRHENRSARKLLGIAACLTAVLLLSLSGGSAAEDPSDAGIVSRESGAALGVLKCFLFLACIVTWAFSDTLASYVAKPSPDGPRSLHTFTIELGCCVGFGCCALFCAALHLAIAATTPSPPPPQLLMQLQQLQQQLHAAGLSSNGTNGTDYGGAQYDSSGTNGANAVPSLGAWIGGQAVLFAAQACGILGQYATVKLGQNDAEASSFLPLISMYSVSVSVHRQQYWRVFLPLASI